MPALAIGKRKDPPKSSDPKPHRPVKRARTKLEEARTILTQTSGKALNKNGDLNIASFIKAREFEIKAMGTSMVSSKNALSTRAFQQLPKEMRRRTASHNVKRVPKRLRMKAAREMKADNTPTMTSRRRIPTPHQRLRLGKARKLKQLGILTKEMRARSKRQKRKHPTGETDPEKTVAITSRLHKLKKDVLSKPTRPPARYRKRQTHKSWLPTHVWHAKRAKMTDPRDSLWRFAIPLSPTEKCFRVAHRASSVRGCMAWDTSYMGNIGAEGMEAGLVGLLRALGVEESSLTGKKGDKWRKGTRSWEGWIRERDGERRWIAPLVVVWCACEDSSTRSDTRPEKKKDRRKLLIRIHPSAFLQVWNEVLKVAKIQRPQVMIEDLRFEIGSIEITGPGAMEALVGVLHPVAGEETADNNPFARDPGTAMTDQLEGSRIDANTLVAKGEEDWIDVPNPSEVFSQLYCITNPSSLPPNALLAFNIIDPRLRHPPRTVQSSRNDHDNILDLLSTWPPDQTTVPPSIFDRLKRLNGSRLPSQKAINRRKADAGPGIFPLRLPKDPQIPIMLLVSRAPHPGSIKQNRSSGCYTVLLPWPCVQPLWYSLMHYPLSGGGTPHFGGLQEKRQIAFESKTPWFPGDFPGTRAGWAWEMKERERKKTEWDRRPKGKRCEWESVNLGGKRGEIGLGWGCDWEKLFSGRSTVGHEALANAPGKDAINNENHASVDKSTTVTSAIANKARHAWTTDAEDQDRLPPRVPLLIHHIPSSSIIPETPLHIPLTALTPIHLTLTTGHPSRNARIYRLPTASPDLRARWLALAPMSTSKHRSRLARSNGDGHQLPPLPKNAPQYAKAQRLAASLTVSQHSTTNGGNEVVLNPSDPGYPPVPDEHDLIGYVTTANFQLGEGRCEAIGNVAVSRVLEAGNQDIDTGHVDGQPGGRTSETKTLKRVAKLCIVRDAGQSVGRLATWTFI